MREGVLSAGALGLGDRALAPLDHRAWTPLMVKDLGVPAEKPRPLGSCSVSFDILEHAQRLAEPTQRLWIAPDPQWHDRLLLNQTGLLDRPGGKCLP
jgi:hypothetical protein